MRAFTLQSGSNGNCIYVETGDARLLLDAGISGVQTRDRLRAREVDIAGVDAVIISHNHSDHIASAGVLHRKFGLPVYVTRKTYEAGNRSGRLGRIGDLRHFESGETLRFGETRVETVPTPHDGVDGSAFVVARGDRRLGILTDLGHITSSLKALLCELDAVFLESNYDEVLLENGPYPARLKARIRGAGGHLSNEDAAALLETVSGRLQWACLAHLSEENNTPKTALSTVLARAPRHLPVVAASRYSVGELLTVR